MGDSCFVDRGAADVVSAPSGPTDANGEVTFTVTSSAIGSSAGKAAAPSARGRRAGSSERSAAVNTARAKARVLCRAASPSHSCWPMRITRATVSEDRDSSGTPRPCRSAKNTSAAFSSFMM